MSPLFLLSRIQHLCQILFVLPVKTVPLAGRKQWEEVMKRKVSREEAPNKDRSRVG